MKKLSEVNSSQYVKVLVYGESGTGKTCFAAGFPTPILYLDFDGKVSSAAEYYKSDTERLEGISVEPLTPSLNSEPITKLTEILRSLEKDLTSGLNPYKTIVLDSLTTFSQECLKHIVRTNPGIKRVINKQGASPGLQDYGILKREFARIIPGLLALDMNIVMLGHVHMDKDDVTGELHRRTKLDGSFAVDLPIYFEEVYHSYTKDGKYLAQTQSDYKYKCRTQRGLDKVIELKYKNIVERT